MTKPHLRVRRLLVSLVATAALGVSTLASTPASTQPAPVEPRRAAEAPRPLIYDRNFADPTVITDGSTWLAAATGFRGRRSVSSSQYGPFWAAGDLLDRRPAWAKYAGVWAPDLDRAPDGTWLAYYTMPSRGLPHEQDRCIGVATAPDINSTFSPVSDEPLVCPYSPEVPVAGDQLRTRDSSLPRRGVIDPSSFIASDGRRYLLYRTQGTPSTIRLVRLDDSGTRVLRVSKEIVRDNGVLENPILVQDRGYHYLITSRGNFDDCLYRTVWRRSKVRFKGYGDKAGKVLLNRKRTGICGPGGADYIADAEGHPNRMFFHGWVCDGTNLPCPAGYNATRDPHRRGNRGLYAVRLRWTKNGPQIASFVQGPPWTPPTETPTPTPTETPVPLPTLVPTPAPAPPTTLPKTAPTTSPTAPPAG